jgi:hypothetical protein
MATIKICDCCGIYSTIAKVGGYRWMKLMDKDDYKHTMLIKLDLCDKCEALIQNEIWAFINKTSV